MKRHELLHTTDRKFKCDVCGRGFLRQSNLDLHAVMHQKGPKEGGPRRGRPKPKKRQVETEMREFVANVLSNVRKVDSSQQTDSQLQASNSLIHGVKLDANNSAETDTGTDNLSALVNLAVEQQNSSQAVHIGDIADLQNLVNNDQQITLVMHDDGSGSYLISNVAEEINQLPSQQVEISTGYSDTVVNDEVGEGDGNSIEKKTRIVDVKSLQNTVSDGAALEESISQENVERKGQILLVKERK